MLVLLLQRKIFLFKDWFIADLYVLALNLDKSQLNKVQAETIDHRKCVWL